MFKMDNQSDKSTIISEFVDVRNKKSRLPPIISQDLFDSCYTENQEQQVSQCSNTTQVLFNQPLITSPNRSPVILSPEHRTSLQKHLELTSRTADPISIDILNRKCFRELKNNKSKPMKRLKQRSLSCSYSFDSVPLQFKRSQPSSESLLVKQTKQAAEADKNNNVNTISNFDLSLLTNQNFVTPDSGIDIADNETTIAPSKRIDDLLKDIHDKVDKEDLEQPQDFFRLAAETIPLQIMLRDLLLEEVDTLCEQKLERISLSKKQRSANKYRSTVNGFNFDPVQNPPILRSPTESTSSGEDDNLMVFQEEPVRTSEFGITTIPNWRCLKY